MRGKAENFEETKKKTEGKTGEEREKQSDDGRSAQIDANFSVFLCFNELGT